MHSSQFPLGSTCFRSTEVSSFRRLGRPSCKKVSQSYYRKAIDSESRSEPSIFIRFADTLAKRGELGPASAELPNSLSFIIEPRCTDGYFLFAFVMYIQAQGVPQVENE